MAKRKPDTAMNTPHVAAPVVSGFAKQIADAQARFTRAKHKILELNAISQIHRTHRVIDAAQVKLNALHERDVLRQEMNPLSPTEVVMHLKGAWDEFIIKDTPTDFGGGFIGEILFVMQNPQTGECWYVMAWQWPADEEFPLHAHGWPEYFLVFSGHLAFYFGTQVIDLPAGRGIYVPGEVAHGGISLEATYLLHFIPCDPACPIPIRPMLGQQRKKPRNGT